MDIHTQFKIVDALDNRNIRVEHIQFLPSCTSAEAFNDVVWQLLEDDTGEDLKRSIINGGAMIDAIADLIDGEPFDEPFVDMPTYDQRALLAEYFSKYRYRTNWPTLLVQVATPVRDYTGRGSGYGYSWGYYTTQWIAGQSVRDILKHVVKWHRERVAAWKNKAKDAA